MIDFVVKYWVQELFALVIALITWLVRQVKCKDKTITVTFKDGTEITAE